MLVVLSIKEALFRVGTDIWTRYIYGTFGGDIFQIYGHIRCIYTVLANLLFSIIDVGVVFTVCVVFAFLEGVSSVP